MRLHHIILAIITAAIWGVNFVFVAVALNETPPYLLCVLRFLLAAVPAVFFLPKPNIPFKLLFAYGFFTFTLQFALLFGGINAGMPPGLTSLIFQCQVFFSLLFAAIFLKEIPSRIQGLGAIVAFVGLSVICIKFSNSATWIGFIMVIGAAASMGFGNLVSRKLAHAQPVALVAWGSLVALPPLILLSLYIEGPALITHSLSHLSWTTLASLGFIAYISTWLGYGVWNNLLSKYTVSTVIPFTLLVPVFGMLASNLIFNEKLQSWGIGAAGLIILGLTINILGSKLIARRQKIQPDQAPAVETAELPALDA